MKKSEFKQIIKEAINEASTNNVLTIVDDNLFELRKDLEKYGVDKRTSIAVINNMFNVAKKSLKGIQ